MSKIKQLFRYLLPVLALPTISSLCSTAFSAISSQFGTSAIVALSTLRAVTSPLNATLYIISMVGLVSAAICSEGGKLKAAKVLHLISFILCSVILLVYLLALLFCPELIIRTYAFSPETTAAGAEMARAFAAIVLVLALHATLAAQLVRRYSMILTLCVCGVLQFVSIFGVLLASILQMGYVPLGAFEGLVFACSRVLPFMLIPLASYYKSFYTVPALSDAQ